MLAGLSGEYIFRMPPCFWQCRLGGEHREEQRARRRESSQFASSPVPPLAFAGSRTAPRLRTPAKPAVEARYARPICWASVAGLDARKDTTYSFQDQRIASSLRSFINVVR
jgi:hypothetical protein